MENPYAHSTEPAPATPEEQKLADYELAVGQNANYYVPKFEEFDKGGSKLGWNWPAFFLTTPWFLYRRMWGWGLGNVAYFWGMLTLVAPIALAFAATAAGKGHEAGALTKICIVLAVLTAIPWFVLPMYANALYWRHIDNLVTKVPASLRSQPEKRLARIRRNGGTGAGAMIGVLVGAALIFIVIVGILAAIAIPAYQDYTIRAQVSEGLNLVPETKAAVAEYYVHHGEWPLDGETAGLHPIRGVYVESVSVANGSIVITYGGRANSKLAGQRLILSPAITRTDEIIWICGEHRASDDAEIVTRGPGPDGSDLPAKYLPANCRP